MAGMSPAANCSQSLELTFDLDWVNQSCDPFRKILEQTFNSTDINTFFFYETEQLAFLWILFILIFVGNMAVLLALGVSKVRKSRMNYFVRHLAIADLSVGLISVLTDIAWKHTIAWYAGNIACKIIRYLQILVTYSSTYVLVALSIDRYDAITHPMNFTRGWRRAKFLVAVAWILSAIFSTPALVLSEEREIQQKTQCWIELTQVQWQFYITLVSVILFFVPAVIISACYIVIVRTIWVQSVALTTTGCAQANRRPARSNRGGAIVLDEDQESRRASSRGIIPRAKIKTVKMTFVIVSVFILCWSPYFVYDLLQVYDSLGPPTPTSNAIATFMQSLAPLNSAANPLIYCFFSTRICRNLRKIPAVEWLIRRLGVLFRFVCPGSKWRTCAEDVANQQTPLQTNSSARAQLFLRRLGTRSSNSATQTTRLSCSSTRSTRILNQNKAFRSHNQKTVVFRQPTQEVATTNGCYPNGTNQGSYRNEWV